MVRRLLFRNPCTESSKRLPDRLNRSPSLLYQRVPTLNEWPDVCLRDSRVHHEHRAWCIRRPRRRGDVRHGRDCRGRREEECVRGQNGWHLLLRRLIAAELHAPPIGKEVADELHLQRLRHSKDEIGITAKHFVESIDELSIQKVTLPPIHPCTARVR